MVFVSIFKQLTFETILKKLLKAKTIQKTEEKEKKKGRDEFRTWILMPLKKHGKIERLLFHDFTAMVRNPLLSPEFVFI